MTPTMKGKGLVRIKKPYAGHFVYQWVAPADLQAKLADGWTEA